MSDEQVPFEVVEETVVHDLTGVQDSRSVKPKAKGVRIRIEKPEVRVSYKDNAKEVAKGTAENPAAFKYLNVSCRIMDGLEIDKVDEDGNPTGEKELKYKNSVLFPSRMDLIFWHNPEVKTSDWWTKRSYAVGFKQFCQALKFDLKEIRVNDGFLALIKDKEVLVDIDHEEEQEQKEGKWVGKGTFKERLRNWQAWE